MNEAVFGGLNRSLESLSLRQSAAKKRDSQQQGKVTIPIDWDDIINNHIKNTNTNVNDANRSSSAAQAEDIDDIFF